MPKALLKRVCSRWAHDGLLRACRRKSLPSPRKGSGPWSRVASMPEAQSSGTLWYGLVPLACSFGSSCRASEAIAQSMATLLVPQYLQPTHPNGGALCIQALIRMKLQPQAPELPQPTGSKPSGFKHNYPFCTLEPYTTACQKLSGSCIPFNRSNPL